MSSQEYIKGMNRYYSMLQKRLWIVVLAVFLTTSVMTVFSIFFLDKVYEASTKLVITKRAEAGKELQYNDLIFNQRLVKTYSEIAKSRTIANQVIHNLQLNMSNKDFASKVQVSSIKDTEVLEIRVKHTDPETAARMVDEVSKVFMERVVTLLNIDNIQILDSAEIPSKPIKPDIVSNALMAGMLGLMLGMGILFILDARDNSSDAVKVVEDGLAIPVIGAIPLFRDIYFKVDMIPLRNPSAAISEAYRSFRTNIQLINSDKEIKSIVFTSAQASEGKSTSIVNLAVTMAGVGYKTLLVDANFRQPHLHSVLKVENDLGLADILHGKWIEDIIIHVEEAGFDIITTGSNPRIPTDMLASLKVEQLFRELESTYDFILIDTPPIGVHPDGLLLSMIVDGTIFVVDASKISYEKLLEAKQALEKVRAYVIGALINKTI